jgi:hypothetical protein
MVNRELEGLRQAFNHAAKLTPPLFPRHRVPGFPMLPVDNVRQGFFEVADIVAVLKAVPDPDMRLHRMGLSRRMRKGELTRLTWEMLNRSGSTWTLRIPGRSPRTSSPASWRSRARYAPSWSVAF